MGRPPYPYLTGRDLSPDQARARQERDVRSSFTFELVSVVPLLAVTPYLCRSVRRMLPGEESIDKRQVQPEPLTGSRGCGVLFSAEGADSWRRA